MIIIIIPQDKISGVIQKIFTKPVANSCFSIIAKVLLHSVVNLFCKLKILNYVTIVGIICIEISSHFIFSFIYILIIV